MEGVLRTTARTPAPESVGWLKALGALILGAVPRELGLRIIRIELQTRTTGPTIASLYSPVATLRIAAGADLTASLVVAGPPRCQARLDTLEARIAVAGITRSQQLPFAAPLQSVCRPR